MLLITAPPGAGKTRRLVSDIKERLASGISPYAIFATTFTRMATKEIAGRLGNEVPVRTLHGFAYWIIKLSRKARGDRIPRIISADESREILQRAIDELNVRYVDPREVLDDMAWVRERGGLEQSLQPQVVEVIERYRLIMQTHNLLDFTGILEEARKELENPDLQQFLNGLHIFVDESQDINPQTEWPILESLLGGAVELVMFASPSQQIYGFRGANWGQLCARFPDELLVESMRENFRSTPEIVRTAAKLAGPDADRMIAVRESIGTGVVVVETLNVGAEIDYIGRQIGDWVGKGIDYEETAVLARSHSMLNALQISLRTKDIPFQLINGQRNIFQRPEAEVVLGYLQLALDPMEDRVLEAIIDFPPCGIGARTRYALRRNVPLRWDHLTDALSDSDKFRPQVIRRIRQVLDLREQIDDIRRQKLPPHQTIIRLLELSGIPSYLMGEGDAQTFHAINDLAALSTEFGSLKEYVDYLQTEFARPREAEGVHLSTLHAAKGQEWDAVIIPGLNEGTIPLDGADPAGEQNLVFVGISRPRLHLVLTSNRVRRPSQFIEKLPVDVTQWPSL